MGVVRRGGVSCRLLGYAGYFDPRMHFGIPADGPVELDVRWPDGTTSTLSGVALDSEIVVVQP